MRQSVGGIGRPHTLEEGPLLFKKVLFSSLVSGTMLLGLTTPGNAERIDRGSQVIQGTHVRTTIYHERGYAVFENDCGSQRLSQGQLQAGAIPRDIIPCPRPGATTPSAPRPSSEQRLWAAVAAGIQSGGLFGKSKVGIGLGRNYSSRAEAERGAVSTCQERVRSCQVVAAWNTGCYYITVSDGADNVAWGSGPTAQRAYDECYRRVKGGNCKTQTLGHCFP